MRPFISLAVAGLALFAGNAIAATTTQTIYASSDATVYSSVDGGPTDSSLDPADGFIRVFGCCTVDQGIWEYSLAGLAPSSSIESASVYFHLSGTVVDGLMLLYGFAGSGIAGAADANLPMTQIGSFNIMGHGDYNVSLDTAYLQSLADLGVPYLGIQMVSTSAGEFGPGGDFCSIEGAYDSTYASYCGSTTTSRVTLNIGAANGTVPEPGTWAMMLFGFGAVGFAMRRRRRSASAQPLLALALSHTH